jgi:hypothetical protein
MKLRRWRLYAKPLTVWLMRDNTSRKNKNDKSSILPKGVFEKWT